MVGLNIWWWKVLAIEYSGSTFFGQIVKRGDLAAYEGEEIAFEPYLQCFLRAKSGGRCAWSDVTRGVVCGVMVSLPITSSYHSQPTPKLLLHRVWYYNR